MPKKVVDLYVVGTIKEFGCMVVQFTNKYQFVLVEYHK